MISSAGAGISLGGAGISSAARRDCLAVAILGIVFGLQALRALLPSMVYVLKDRMGVPSVGLALFGIALFSLSGFAPRWIRARSPLRATLLLAGFLAGARALLQLWPGDPLGFLALSALAVIVLFALLASLPAADGARIFFCGAAIDLALHALYKTEDLHWSAGMPDAVMILLAAAALFLAHRAHRQTAELEFPEMPELSRGIFVWGPFLFLHLEVLGNVARFSARTETSPELAGAFLLACNAAALAVLSQGKSRSRKWMMAAALAAPLSFVLAGAPGFPAYAQLPAATLSCAILLQCALLRAGASGAGAARAGASRIGRGPSFAFGSVLFILLTFAHYAAYDLQFPWTRFHVWIAAALILAAAALARGERAVAELRTMKLVAIPLALNLVLVLAAARERREIPSTSQLLPNPVRIVSFNLHAGFDESGSFAFRSMMEKLAAEEADLIALQEVSRGWIINGSADLFELARSALSGEGVFRPSVGRDWGNAVFSKAAVRSVEELALPPPDLSLSRAVLAVDLGTESVGALRILATHFHHRTADDAIRVQQSRAVVGHFRGVEPSVLLGDLNATPGSETFEILQDAGWREVLPPGQHFTYPSKSPDRRIDTMFLRGPLEIADARIAPPWGSDHRAVVADLIVRRE